MTERVRIEQLPMHRDARGSVIEPLGPDDLPAQRNVHLVVTEPGGIRGNHYHERGTEVLVVYGPALIRLREGGSIHDTAVPAGEAYRFTIPPLVSHAVQNTGREAGVLIAFNTVAHDPTRPDLVRDPILEG